MVACWRRDFITNLFPSNPQVSVYPIFLRLLADVQLDRLEKDVQKLKEDINSKSEELDIRQRCLKEFQMMSSERQLRGSGANVEDASRQELLRRKNEIFFSRAHWKLTETDGQLGKAYFYRVVVASGLPWNFMKYSRTPQ